MRIIQNKGSTLTLRDQLPRGLALLFGIAFGGAGILIIIFVAQLAVLDCYRETVTPTCEIRRQFLGRNETIAIGTPRRAFVQESTDSDGDSTYRVAIESDRGTYPIVTYHSSGRNDKRQQRDRIEQFIADPNQTSLSIAIDNRWWSYPFGGVFGLTGLAFSLSLFRHTDYRFDRTYRHLSVERTVFGRTQKKTYPLAAIKSIVLEESTDSDGTTYRVGIFLNSGERLGSTSYDSGQAEKVKVVKTANSFLGLLPPSS